MKRRKTSFWMDYLFAGFVVVVVGMWRPPMAVGADQMNKTTSVVKVGVVLDLSSWVGKMGLSCINISLSDFYSSNPQHNTTIQLHITDSKDDLVLAATQASELIQKSEVKAIIGPESSFQAPYIIKLSEKSEIPLISFAPPPTSTFSNLKSPYLFRAPYSHLSQIYAICDIIKAFGWKQVVIIYQDDEFGKWIVADLIQALQVDVQSEEGIKEEEVYTHVHRIDRAASGDQIREKLKRLSMKQQANVFVVHMVHSLASKVFTMANEIGMMSEGYAWIFTADSTTTALNFMNNNNFSSTLSLMQGVLGVKTYVPRTMNLHNFTVRWRRKFLQDNPDMIIEYYPNPDVFGLWAYDATWALAMAVERNFNISAGVSQNGKKIMESLSMIKFKGLSQGEFSLSKGQLELSNLQIVNVIGDGEISTVGYWKPEMGLTGEFNKKVKLRPIIWPGYSIQPPKEGIIPFNPRKILRIGVPLNQFMPFSMSNGSISGYCIDIFRAAVEELDRSFPYQFIPVKGIYDDLIVAVYRGVGSEIISGFDLNTYEKSSEIINCW